MKFICDKCKNIVPKIITPPCILEIGDDSEWPDYCPFDKREKPEWRVLNEN